MLNKLKNNPKFQEWGLWFLQVSSSLVVVICGYYVIYQSYDYVLTHPREDASMVGAFLLYLLWQYSISPSKE